MWEISGFVRAAWSVLRMTEASETTKWSLEADNILCVCVCVCSSVCSSVCWCLSSEPSLFFKVFVHVAGRDAAPPVRLYSIRTTCGSVRVFFWPVVGLCLCVCVLSVCVLSRQRHDRRERWFSLAVVVSESAREPTGSKWYSLVLNARVGRPALLQPLVSCYIMTWRWRGTTLLQKEEGGREERRRRRRRRSRSRQGGMRSAGCLAEVI